LSQAYMIPFRCKSIITWFDTVQPSFDPNIASTDKSLREKAYLNEIGTEYCISADLISNTKVWQLDDMPSAVETKTIGAQTPNCLAMEITLWLTR
jgi:hypothetical protein